MVPTCCSNCQRNSHLQPSYTILFSNFQSRLESYKQFMLCVLCGLVLILVAVVAFVVVYIKTNVTGSSHN